MKDTQRAMVSTEDKFQALLDRFFQPEEPDTDVSVLELSPQPWIAEEYRYAERTFLRNSSSASPRPIGESSRDERKRHITSSDRDFLMSELQTSDTCYDDTSSTHLRYHSPLLYYRIKQMLASCAANGISAPAYLHEIQRLKMPQEELITTLFVGKLSFQDEQKHVESRKAEVLVEFLSEKYRYCRNKVVHREEVDLRQIRIPGPFSSARNSTRFPGRVNDRSVDDRDPEEKTSKEAMGSDVEESTRLLPNLLRKIELSEVEKGSAAACSSKFEVGAESDSRRKRKGNSNRINASCETIAHTDGNTGHSGVAKSEEEERVIRSKEEKKATRVSKASGDADRSRRDPLPSNQETRQEETCYNTKQSSEDEKTSRRGGWNKTGDGISGEAMQKKSMCFFPAYDEDKFIEVNVNVPLITLFPLLVLYRVCHAKLMNRKIEGYWRDEISARTLLRDLSLYCKIFGSSGINFDDQLDKIESSIADVSRRRAEDIELFEMFSLIKRISTIRRSRNTEEGEDTGVSMNLHSSLCSEEKSSLYGKILQHLRQVSGLSGWMKVYRMWESVRVYESKGIGVSRGLLEDLIGDVKVPKHFSLAAIRAMSSMGLSVPKTLYYAKLIGELTEAFEKALDKSIKEGYPTTTLFESARRLMDVDTGCSGEFKEHARKKVEAAVQRRFMRRIEKAKKLEEIERIERAYNSASYYFESLERVSWALVAKKMSFSHHQLLKN